MRTQTCPYCGAQIPRQAVVCRHCDTILDRSIPADVTVADTDDVETWKPPDRQGERQPAPTPAASIPAKAVLVAGAAASLAGAGLFLVSTPIVAAPVTVIGAALLAAGLSNPGNKR